MQTEAGLKIMPAIKSFQMMSKNQRMNRIRSSVSIAPSAPKPLRNIRLTISPRYAEELGTPLVNQSSQVPLQSPKECGAGLKTSRQGSAQIRP